MAIPSKEPTSVAPVTERQASASSARVDEPIGASIRRGGAKDQERAGGGGRDARLAAEIDGLALNPIQRAYLAERWLGQLRYLGQSARWAQRRYYALRLVAILGGVTIPALIGLDVGDNRGIVQWTAFALGLLVAAAVALEEFFRFGERWRHFRQQSELLRSEGWGFLELSGPAYRRYESHAAAFPTFVARAEEQMRQEVGVYVTDVVRPQEEARGTTENAAPDVTPAAPKVDERPGAAR